jgi:hypothetical protein
MPSETTKTAHFANIYSTMWLVCSGFCRSRSIKPCKSRAVVRVPAAVKRSSEINQMRSLTMAFGAFDAVRVIPTTPSPMEK